jgi:hypothetical protein
MRLGLVLLLTAAFFVVIPSDSLAIRFADTPCVESGTSRVCPAGVAGRPYVVRISGEGGCGPDPNIPGSGLPYQYRVLNGSLPPGLALDKDGLLHGTPATAGRWSFWVELSDEDPPSAAWCMPVKSEREFVVTIGAPPATIGTAYAVQVSAEGVGALAWSIASGMLPQGLALSPVAGVISGTPAINGTFPLRLEATDSRGVTATVELTIIVYPRLTFATTRLVPARVGRSYRATIRTRGSIRPVALAVVTGRLPIGMRLNTKTGVLSGKPHKSGTYKVTIGAQDGLRRTTKHAYVLVVRPLTPIAET